MNDRRIASHDRRFTPEVSGFPLRITSERRVDSEMRARFLKATEQIDVYKLYVESGVRIGIKLARQKNNLQEVREVEKILKEVDECQKT